MIYRRSIKPNLKHLIECHLKLLYIGFPTLSNESVIIPNVKGKIGMWLEYLYNIIAWSTNFKGPDRELAYTPLFPLNTTKYHEMPLIEANWTFFPYNFMISNIYKWKCIWKCLWVFKKMAFKWSSTKKSIILKLKVMSAKYK